MFLVVSVRHFVHSGAPMLDVKSMLKEYNTLICINEIEILLIFLGDAKNQEVHDDGGHPQG